MNERSRQLRDPRPKVVRLVDRRTGQKPPPTVVRVATAIEGAADKAGEDDLPS